MIPKIQLLTIAAYICLVFTTNAYAYLDPGTGSMMLQLLLGGAAGLVLLVKLYWSKLVGFFKFKKSDESKPGQDKP